MSEPITTERRQLLVDILPRIFTSGVSAETILTSYNLDVKAYEAALVALEAENGALSAEVERLGNIIASGIHSCGDLKVAPGGLMAENERLREVLR